ncbi:MAG TPA: NAD(P)-binding domain-containing protein [Polyangiaceae bacterium]|nr:NAD(P)-binding domain-containing protein [Polyangiaceae bacterium]
MNIGILGSGSVAQSLATGFLKHGHAVMLGTRDPEKLGAWRSKNPKATLGSNAEAARFGQVVVLAAKGTAAAESLRLAGAANLAGKPVIDTTNPIAEGPPQQGVLPYFTSLSESLMERLQREFPDARLVKAFNSVGAPLMVDPPFKERPTMFLCGNDDAAKGIVARIVEQFGWEPADMGRAESARAIEPLCMLWCIPGLARNDWSPRAFRLVKS